MATSWQKSNPLAFAAYQKQYHLKHKERYNQQHRERRQKLKLRVYDKLGNKCKTCGYDKDPRAFQIDHINGGGKQENLRSRTEMFYKRVLEDTEGKYQLLCANCNQIKRWTNHEGIFYTESKRTGCNFC